MQPSKFEQSTIKRCTYLIYNGNAKCSLYTVYTVVPSRVELRKSFRSELLFTRTVRSRSFPAGNNEPSSSAVTRVGHPPEPGPFATRRTRILALDPRAWRIRRFSERSPDVLRNNLGRNEGDARKLASSLRHVAPRVFRIVSSTPDTSFRCDTFSSAAASEDTSLPFPRKPKYPHDRYLGEIS